MDNVTPRAQQLLGHARRSADRYAQASVGSEHLLLALLDLGDGVGIATLKNLGADLAKIRGSIEDQIKSGHQLRIQPVIPARDDFLSTMRVAATEAAELGDSHLGTEHVLLALLSGSDGIAAHALKSGGIQLVQARAMVMQTRVAIGPYKRKGN